MALQHILKNSAVSGKEPTASQLANGEIALNYHADGPFLSCKDTSGTIRRITGVWISTISPSTPTPGEFWLDISTTPAQLKVYKDTTDNWIQTYTVAVASTTVSGIVELATDAETITGADALRAVTPASLQAKLSDSTGLASSTRIASSTAVKSAYDLANAALPQAGGTITGNLEIGLGSAAAPTFRYTGDTNTGLFSPGADQLSVTTGGVERLRIDATGQIESVALGSAAAPTYTFTTDSNTGIYSPGADQLAISTGGAARFRVDGGGNVALGPSLPAAAWSEFVVTGNAALQAAAPVFNFVNAAGSARFAYMQHTGTGGDLFLLNQEAGAFRLGTNNTERARIDSSGRLLVGTSTARSTFVGSLGAPLVQFEGSGINGYLSITQTEAGSGASALILAKTRSTGNTVLQEGDTIGIITFEGNDGTDFNSGARISAVVDGTPGLNDMPGRLVFSTTADGASTPTERMRIDSSGRVGIGTAAPQSTLNVNGSARFQNAASFAGINVLNANDSSLTTTTSFFDASNNLGTVDGHLFFEHLTTGGSNAVIATTPAGDRSVDRRVTRLIINSSGSTTLNSAAATAPLITQISGAEVARIDASGRLLVGTSASITTLVQAGLQAHGTGTLGYINSGRWSNDGNRSELIFSKSRGGTVGTRALVSADDGLGGVTFTGDDGASFVQAANIIAYVDGTPGLNDMPGRLVFSTTADGASSPTERMRIDRAGNVGIGGTPGSYKLDVQGGVQRILNQGSTSALEIGTGTTTSQTAHIDLTTDTTYADFGLRLIRDGAGGANGVSQLQQKGTGELSLRCIEAAPLTFYTTNTERARIDSSGRLLVGTSSSITGLFSNAAAVQLNASFGTQALALTRFSANNFGADIDFLKSRNATVGAHTIVQSSDQIANLNFAGSDGTAFIAAAGISANIDGTPGANDMPGRLVFSTTADGASSPTERLRIDSSGRVGIGTPSDGSRLLVYGEGTTANTLSVVNPSATNGAVLYFGDSNQSSAIKTIPSGGTHSLGFFVAGANTERMRIDSNGRVGIGTSSPQTSLDIGTGGMARVASASGNNQIQVSTGSNGLGMWAGGATRFYTTGGMTFSVNSTIGTGIPTGYTDAITIDSSGKVGIGTSSPAELLEISALTDPKLRFVDVGNIDAKIGIVGSTALGFEVGGTERVRIDSTGLVSVVTSTAAGNGAFLVSNPNNTSGSGVATLANRANNNNTSSYYLVCQEPGVANRCFIYGNGNLANLNNVYGAISDIKLKENIADASSQWNDIKNLQIRKYNFKQNIGYQTHTQIGLVAQEAELVSPGLVYETTDRDSDGNDLGTVTKSVNYSVLYMKAVKALQEAMDRIETLEAKVAALEAP